MIAPQEVHVYLYIPYFSANQCQNKNKSFDTKINASTVILKRLKMTGQENSTAKMVIIF